MDQRNAYRPTELIIWDRIYGTSLKPRIKELKYQIPHYNECPSFPDLTIGFSAPYSKDRLRNGPSFFITETTALLYILSQGISPLLIFLFRIDEIDPLNMKPVKAYSIPAFFVKIFHETYHTLRYDGSIFHLLSNSRILNYSTRLDTSYFYPTRSQNQLTSFSPIFKTSRSKIRLLVHSF